MARKMDALKGCVNHPDRPVKPPSKVLCAECLEELNGKMEDMLNRFPSTA